MKNKELDICKKEFWTLKQASIYTGIGINCLKNYVDKHKNELILFVGRKRLIRKEALMNMLANENNI